MLFGMLLVEQNNVYITVYFLKLKILNDRNVTSISKYIFITYSSYCNYIFFENNK